MGKSHPSKLATLANALVPDRCIPSTMTAVRTDALMSVEGCFCPLKVSLSNEMKNEGRLI
ncbi:hypothetical protein TomMM35A_33860 [Sphingobium sp. TomMM35A]